MYADHGERRLTNLNFEMTMQSAKSATVIITMIAPILAIDLFITLVPFLDVKASERGDFLYL